MAGYYPMFRFDAWFTPRDFNICPSCTRQFYTIYRSALTNPAAPQPPAVTSPVINSRKIVIKVTEMVIYEKLSRNEAAELLETSVRSVHNYVKQYLQHGPQRLLDHRRGHYRKLTPEIEEQIVACKAQKSERSARWIRNRLKLNVSVETVRRVLIKHNFSSNKKNRTRISTLDANL